MAIETRLRLRGESDTARAFASTQRSLTGLATKIKGVTKVAARFGVVLGTAATVGFAKKVVTLQDTLGKFADQLGVTVEQLSQYQFVAEKAGISQQSFLTGVQRLLRRTAEAAKGLGEAQRAFKELNIDAAAFGQLDLNDKLRVLANAISGVADENERLAIAFKLFDTEGVAFLRILNDGTDALDAAIAETREFSTITQEAAAESAAWKDEITDLTRKFQNFIGADLSRGIGQIKFVINTFTDAKNAVTDFVERGLVGLGVIDQQFNAKDGIPFYLKRTSDAAKTAKSDIDAVAASVAATGPVDDDPEDVAAIQEALELRRRAIENIARLRRESERDVINEIGELEIQKAREIEEERRQGYSGLSYVIEDAISTGGEEGAKGMVAAIISSVQRNLVGQLATLLAGAIGGSGGGGGFLAGLLSFDTGGVVPGSTGQPRLAVVHGGETILPTHRTGAAGGVQVTQNLNVSGASRAEFAVAAEALKEQTKMEVMDMIRRGR